MNTLQRIISIVALAGCTTPTHAQWECDWSSWYSEQTRQCEGVWTPGFVGIAGEPSLDAGLTINTWAESPKWAIDALNMGIGGGGIRGASVIPSGVSYGVQGEASTSSGAGVFGYNYGAGQGVKGESIGQHGRGLWGIASGTSGNGIGVMGESWASDGYGIYGSSPNIGVLGFAWDTDGIGVYAASEGANGFAGYFYGRSYFDSHIGIGRETPYNPYSMLSIKQDTAGWSGMYMETSSAGGRPFYGYSAGGNTDAYHYFDGSNDRWALYVGGTRLVVNRSNGNVGVATTSPAYQLHVNGSAGKPGGGSWSNASDIRLKSNVQPLENALDRILALRGVTFEYIDPDAVNERHGEQIGMIAQEVERVFPDWVDDGEDGFKRLTFRGFEATAVEALRALHMQNETLKAENEEIRRELQSLKAVVAKLAAEHTGN